MTYKDFLHHKFIQQQGGVHEYDLPNTYDLWKESLTEEQKMKFKMEWEGLDTSTEATGGQTVTLC